MMEETYWPRLLDKFVLSALGDFPLLEREVEEDEFVYRLRSASGRAAEIGHSHAHCWLLLDDRWETHGIGDPEEIEFNLELYVRIARLYVDALISPPVEVEQEPIHTSFLRKRTARRYWSLEEFSVTLRERI